MISLSETQLIADIMQNYFDNNSTNYVDMYKIYSDFAPPVNEKTGSERHDDKQNDLTRFEQVTQNLLEEQLQNNNIIGIVKTYPQKYAEVGGIYGIKLSFTLDMFALMDKDKLQEEVNALMFNSDLKNGNVSSHTNATIPTIDSGNTYRIAWGYNKSNYAVLEPTGYGRRQQLTIVGNIFITLNNSYLSSGYFGDDFTLQIKTPTETGLTDYIAVPEVFSIKPTEVVKVLDDGVNNGSKIQTKVLSSVNTNDVMLSLVLEKENPIARHFMYRSLGEIVDEDEITIEPLEKNIYSLNFLWKQSEIFTKQIEWSRASLLQVSTPLRLGEFVFIDVVFRKTI